jgi:hypothetical protein
MSVVWAVIISVGVVGVAIFFCVIGFMLGADSASVGYDNDRLKWLEAEAKMHDLTRQAFIAMAEASDQATRTPADQPSGGARPDRRFPPELS